LNQTALVKTCESSEQVFRMKWGHVRHCRLWALAYSAVL